MTQRRAQLGRPRGTGRDGIGVSFRLWPQHIEAIERLANRLKISRSEALRQIIDSVSQNGKHMVFCAINRERKRQDTLWGRKSMPEGLELTILVEEVGEVARALQGDGNLKEELTQVAAVCVRWLEALQSTPSAESCNAAKK